MAGTPYFYPRFRRLDDGRMLVEFSSGVCFPNDPNSEYASFGAMLTFETEDRLLDAALPYWRELDALAELARRTKFRAVSLEGETADDTEARIVEILNNLLTSVAARRATRNLLQGDK